MILTSNIQTKIIMATITLKGNPINTIGTLPKVGDHLSDFDLITNGLAHVSLKDFTGNKLVLNIFPSLDTGTCAASVRAFNKAAAGLANTKVLCISRDLPFAQARFCGTEGINNAITLSDFATGQFGRDYQVIITSGPMAHLLSRAVIVADANGKVLYSEQVPEIVDEPNYQAALAAL
jgi:thioredoxin-dependent peroxiredoxin